MVNRWRIRGVGILCGLILCIGLGGNAFADGAVAAPRQDGPVFADIAGHWAEPYIEWAVGEGTASGYGDGTFRPDRNVSEREFLALVFRAYPDLDVPDQAPGEPWHARYYAAAERLGWPVEDQGTSKRYTRGDAARIIAATRGEFLSTEDAVLYLLENGLSHGKTDATLEGYKAGDLLTRAEAVAFLYNIKQAEAEGDATGGFVLRGIRLGDTEAIMLAALGEPDRRDPSADGYTWLVYNRNYGEFAQIGVSGGKVAALYTNANVLQHSGGVTPGASAKTAAAHAGIPESDLKADREYIYQKDGVRIHLYLDQHADGRVEGVLVEKRTGAANSVAATQGDLAAAYERQIFDLSNVFRLKNGLFALEWNDSLAQAARGHSRDMAVNGYFDHNGLNGETVWDRLQAAGFEDYARYAENIAAGYVNAFAAFNGWINSAGHRQNILSDGLEMLGVGVVHEAGSEYGWYYTQNFYTAPWW